MTIGWSAHGKRGESPHQHCARGAVTGTLPGSARLYPHRGASRAPNTSSRM